MTTQEIIQTTQTYQQSIFELWSVVDDCGTLMPLFLIDKGPLEFLILKISKYPNSIIVDSKGKTIAHGKFYD